MLAGREGRSWEIQGTYRIGALAAQLEGVFAFPPPFPIAGSFYAYLLGSPPAAVKIARLYTCNLKEKREVSRTLGFNCAEPECWLFLTVLTKVFLGKMGKKLS